MGAFRDRLLRQPQPGDALIIPSRHPIQICLMVGFVIASFAQFTDPNTNTGLAGKLNDVGTLITQAVVLIIGSLLCIYAAKVAVKDPWLAAGASMSGYTILSPLFIFYTVMYMALIPGYYLTTQFWTTAALAAGFAWRWCQLGVLTLRIWHWRVR